MIKYIRQKLSRKILIVLTMSVVMVLTCFLYEVRFRMVALASCLMVIVSTFALGIHWLGVIAAGVALAVIAVAIARRVARAAVPKVSRGCSAIRSMVAA